MGLLDKLFGKDEEMESFMDRLSGCEEEEELLAGEPC